MKNLRSIPIIIVCMCWLVPSHAQEEEKKGWTFGIAPDLYAPLVSGDVIINGNSARLNRDLELNGMIAFVARNPKWTLYTDLLLTDISVGATLPVTGRQGTFNADFTFWTVGASKRWKKWLNAGLGVRFAFTNSTLFVEQGSVLPGINSNQKLTIFSPIFIYRFDFLETEKWHLALRGDIGGFGIASTFTFLISPFVEYRFFKNFGSYLGYRYLSTYRNDEDGEDRIDVVLSGFQVGVFFRF